MVAINIEREIEEMITQFNKCEQDCLITEYLEELEEIKKDIEGARV